MRIAAVTSFIVAAAYNAPLAQRPSAPVENQRPATGVAPSQQAVLAKYCITCHNQRAKTGGLALDTLNLADVPNHAEEWEKVVRKVRTGAMPPVGRARPDKATAESLVTWLEGELDRAAAERANPGRPTLQRLNRSEYTNAVRDLLAVELDAASLLPADVAGYGFDNNADALTLSPALTERYLGRRGEDRSDGTGPPERASDAGNVFRAERQRSGPANQRRLAVRIARRRRIALLLSGRWRVSLRDAAARDGRVRRIRRRHRRAASALREPRQGPGLDRNYWRTRIRARAWWWCRRCV